MCDEIEYKDLFLAMVLMSLLVYCILAEAVQVKAREDHTDTMRI